MPHAACAVRVRVRVRARARARARVRCASRGLRGCLPLRVLAGALEAGEHLG